MAAHGPDGGRPAAPDVPAREGTCRGAGDVADQGERRGERGTEVRGPATGPPHAAGVPGTADVSGCAGAVDLTTGPVLRGVVRFAAPIAAANLMQQLYLLVDSMVVGRYLGVPGMAAVGASQSLTYLLWTVMFGLNSAFSIRIAHHRGAGTSDRCAVRALARCTVAWSAVSFALTVTGAGTALSVMGVHGALAQDTCRFLEILAAGLLPVFGLAGIAAVFTGRGDSRTAMVLLGAGNVLNGVLVWLLVGPARLGLAGAALATVAANALAAAGGLARLRRRSQHAARGVQGADDGGRPNPTVADELRTTLRIGVPMTTQFLLIAVGMMLLTAVVTGFGATALAAVTVVVRLELFASVVFLGLSSALATFVAQNTGAGRPDRVRQVLWAAIRMTVLLSVVVSVTVMVFRDGVTAAFIDDATAGAVITRYIVITYPSFVCYTLMVVVHGYLNGLGRSVVPLVCTVLSFGVVRLPLSVLLGRWWGIDGVMWAVDVGWAVGLVYTAVAVRRLPPPGPGPGARTGSGWRAAPGAGAGAGVAEAVPGSRRPDH